MVTQEIEFEPHFFYSPGNQLQDVMPFAEASAGQQATSLLSVLLNQEGSPLLIDQPEDDLDNRALNDIIESIWKAKNKRQLIFTSQNAKLVVNGDAELVVCCHYKESNQQTQCEVKYEGAIDDAKIKNEIISIVEGGEKAFKIRKVWILTKHLSPTMVSVTPPLEQRKKNYFKPLKKAFPYQPDSGRSSTEPVSQSSKKFKKDKNSKYPPFPYD